VNFAQNFPDIVSAVDAGLRFRLENMELVLMMGDEPGRYDLTLPLVTVSRPAFGL
jgi:hypothetical protein